MKNKSRIVRGSGAKAIVFIHYFGGNALSWQWTISQLENSFTCILLNLPGFGGTEALPDKNIARYAEFIKEQIEDLSLVDYILCGHSMGAKLAAYAAAKIERKPERLILIAPSPPTVEKMPEEEKKRMLKHPDRKEARNTVNNVTVQELSEEKFIHGINSQLEIEELTWRWWIEEGMNNDVSEIIKTNQIPTTILCSEDDPVIPIEWIENEVKPYFEKSEVVMWSALGHLIPMEAPEKLAREIKRIIGTGE